MSIPTIINDRSILHPYEIDILVPEKNIGIEYNGVVWHSDNLNGKNKNYHLNKTKHCEHNGIRLIQILSPEWLYKKDIVKSRLSHILGRSEKIYGRKCEIKKLEYKIVSKFLEETHIQGSIKSSINYGLFYNNNLVSVMTFSKSRFTKHEYELLRFSNKLNTYVVGGASRLFKQFIKDFNPKSIVSYSDRRWNTGNLYKMLGFTFSHNATPNYFYFNLKQNTDKLYSRLQFQKHKLKDKLDNFKPNLSNTTTGIDANGLAYSISLYDKKNYYSQKNYVIILKKGNNPLFEKNNSGWNYSETFYYVKSMEPLK